MTQTTIYFQNEYIISVENSGALHHQPTKPTPVHEAQPGKADARKRIIPVIGLGVAIAILILSFIAAQSLFFTIGLLIGIYYVYRLVRLRSQKPAEAPRAPYIPKKLTWKRMLVFYENSMEQIDPGETLSLSYADLEKCSRSTLFYDLFFRDHTIVRVQLKGFTVGDADSFWEWIQQKVTPPE